MYGKTTSIYDYTTTLPIALPPCFYTASSNLQSVLGKYDETPFFDSMGNIDIPWLLFLKAEGLVHPLLSWLSVAV